MFSSIIINKVLSGVRAIDIIKSKLMISADMWILIDIPLSAILGDLCAKILLNHTVVRALELNYRFKGSPIFDLPFQRRPNPDYYFKVALV